MHPPDLLHAESEEEALEELHRLGCTDGLPVVVPTPERVERLVVSSGLAADLELGTMGPGGGSATVESLATAAVMAGCLAQHMPIYLAAIEAVIDERFDLTEMQSTTHCTAPLILVNGPARLACGPLSSGFGAFGPGNRANASIGRALRLAMINIGGGRAGESDMALLGHPGKFTYCLAEDEEASPFEPLHVARGFDAEASVVTVVGAEAPHSVISIVDADDPKSKDRLLASLAATIAAPGTNNAILRGGAVVVILNPDHAHILAAANLSRADICAELQGLCRQYISDLSRYVAGPFEGAGETRECIASPEDILVLVAGGGGLYSMVMPSWCAGPHRNAAVSVEVRLGEFCEIPAQPIS